MSPTRFEYGVAEISRPLKMIGLVCKRALLKRRYSAKETYDFKEPTNRSHPIVIIRQITPHINQYVKRDISKWKETRNTDILVILVVIRQMTPYTNQYVKICRQNSKETYTNQKRHVYIKKTHATQTCLWYLRNKTCVKRVTWKSIETYRRDKCRSKKPTKET